MDDSSPSFGTIPRKPLDSLSRRATVALTAIFLIMAVAAAIMLNELHGIRIYANDALNNVLPAAQKRNREAVDTVGLFAAYHKLLHSYGAEEEGDHQGDEITGAGDAGHASSMVPDADADAIKARRSPMVRILNEIILRASSLQMSVDPVQAEELRQVVRLSSRVAELSRKESQYNELLHGYVEHGRLITNEMAILIEKVDLAASENFESSIVAMSDGMGRWMGSVEGSESHSRLTGELHAMSLVRNAGNSIMQMVNRLYRVLLVAEHVTTADDIQRAAHDFELTGQEFYPLVQTLRENPVDAVDVDRIQMLISEFNSLSAMFHDQQRILDISDEKHRASEAVERHLDTVADHLSMEAGEDAEQGIALIVASSELTSMVMFAGILVIGSCFVILVLSGRRHVIRPLSQASDALDALCMGDTDVSLPPMRFREIESIRTSLHRFRASTLELAAVNRRMEGEIQERRRREEEAQRAREQTIAAIESMDEGFALFDRDERLIMHNSKHREMFPLLADKLNSGITFEELIRLNVDAGGYVDAAAHTEAWVQSRLESFRNLQGVPELQLSSGMWVCIVEYRTKDGSTVLTYNDITRQRLAEATLRYQSRLMVMLREIAYGSSEAINLAQAIQVCLEQVCNNTRFDFGHAILTDHGDSASAEESHLWFMSEGSQRAWIHADERQDRFEGICAHLVKMARGEGEPVWVSDFSNICSSACDCMLKRSTTMPVIVSGCAFPVIEHGQVVAVLEFFSVEPLDLEVTLINALVSLSSQLGRTAERQRSVMALKKLRQAVEQSPTMILITDLNGTIEYANPEATATTGFRNDELIGKSPGLFRSGHTRAETHELLWNTIESGEDWRGELLNRRRNGDLYWASISISPVRDEIGRVTHYLGIFEDISEQKKNAEQIEHLAHYDVLTGLPNRALFYTSANRMLSAGKRNGRRSALLMMDLDDFKDVNDSLGHATGDVLLQKVANRLQESMRQCDVVARLGGDEFALLLPDIEDGDSVAIAVQRMIWSIARPYHLENVDLYVNACVGIAIYPDDGSDIDELLKHADLAMYRAKAIGTGSLSFFCDEMDREVSERKELEALMRTALERDEFEIVYQPQYEMATRTLCGAEALLRWYHPERGNLSPGEFIPVAERSGLIVPLGSWVLRRVCQQARAWLDAGLQPLPIAVNLSPIQFKQQDLIETVAAALRDARLPPSSLHLEITEGVLMQDLDANLKTISQLIELGVKIVLDDFGTGYSSLSYLRKLPVHKIKIDRSFIIGVQDDPVKEKIVRIIAMLGNVLGMRVNVEGVETELEYKALLESEIHEAQGFLFSRPISATDYTELLNTLHAVEDSPVEG